MSQSRRQRQSSVRLEGRTAVLVDRRPLWLEAVEQALAPLEVRVVAKTTNPKDLRDLVREHHPDLVVVDIETSRGAADGGFDEIRAVRSDAPATKTIVLTASGDEADVAAAFAAGADAYVVKTADPEDFRLAVRQAFEQSIRLRRPGPSREGDRPPDESGLTRREREILTLVAEGLSNAEVARRLVVTEQTVKFHLANIYRKLGVTNRTEAGRWAYGHNLISGEPAG